LREERNSQSRQQAAIAELGARVSRGDDLFALIQEAAVAHRTLDADLVVVAELLPDGKGLLPRARAATRRAPWIGGATAGSSRDSKWGWTAGRHGLVNTLP
jgi:hypothetical protein